MKSSPHLLLHDNGVYSSLAASQNPSSPCSTPLNSSLHHLCTQRQRAFPSIFHGVGTRDQRIVCDLPRAQYSLRFSHGTTASHRKQARRSTPSHGKVAGLGHTKTKKRIQTQKEAEKALSKCASANPSEYCMARLFKQQPLRLQNSNAIFPAQEVNTVTHKAPRMERVNLFSYTNGSSKVKSFNGDVKLNPEFSVKLLSILSSFKRNNQPTDVKSTGVIDAQHVENNFGEDGLQRHSQSNAFVSFESQREPNLEMERHSRNVDETLIKGTQLSAPKTHVRSSCGTSDFSREDMLDSPMVCTGPQDNRSAFKESGFSAESSDADSCKEENGQAIDELENVSVQHANGSFEHKGRWLSDSAPVPSGKVWSHVFPWHLSRSTGSRSSPSRSSIPGLRSKYSKPDPNAPQQLKKPVQLLEKIEEKTELINRSVFEGEDEEDDVTLQTFQQVHQQSETELKEHVSFDWWNSDDEDDLQCRLSTGSKLPTANKMDPQSKGEAEDSGSSMSFENSHKPIETEFEECISFEWLDLDEEDDLKIKENSMFEWSDSDAEDDVDAEEKSFFKWNDEDAEHDFGTENDTSPNPISIEIEGQSTCTTNGLATSSLRASFDQALTRDSQTNYQDSSEATWKSNNDGGLHQLPASVKFVESPLWKSPIFPDFPFEINYSYSEIPKVPLLGFRDHSSPFTPKTMERPWTGGAHIKPRRHAKSIESFNRALERKKAFELTFNRKRKASKQLKSREDILGKPLTKDEIISLVQNCHEENRQVNLGRDGFTHNMIHLIHTHWKSRPVCKIKCRGVPTLDMDNVCFHVEDKTGGQIIYRSGGTVYVFRGRHYNYKERPVVPFMLFRPASPVYPKLVPQAPAGLTIDEAHQLRILGQKVKPLLELRKNAVLLDLVRDVRDAFQVDDLVSLDYGRLRQCDYRQIGAKLMELVPCVLLSLRNNRIVLWKGGDLKPSSIAGPEACADGARLDGEPTDVQGSCSSDDGFFFPEPNERLINESAQHISKKSVQVHHSDMDSVSGSYLMEDSLDVISEHRHTKVQSQTAAKDMVVVAGNNNLAGGNTTGEMSQQILPERQLLGDIKAPSDVSITPDNRLENWNEHADMCVGGGGIISVLSRTCSIYEAEKYSGNNSIFSVGRAQWDRLEGGDKSTLPSSRLDDLWEMALNNGFAFEIKGVDLDADLILDKVTRFSEVVPAGSVYSERLINRFRLLGLYKKTGKRFVVPLHVIRRKDRGNGQANQTIKSRRSRRAFRSAKIAMSPRTGLQTDVLVKKLECL